ncbi:MAG: PIN domain-containing protein [Limnospira sp. PMC 1291.21]|uniref:PIN domain-containing protein n=3 Tax=Limnospira TaxID=2596745 RepID=A0A9P1KCF7_9CYAN|nr:MULTISPECIES: PIN domain-containing protein [Limnospira]EKD10897.1 PIN domain protein putative [Arthrospira platensis C1]MDC0839275.1 PIN domain-containing protein [Limnoraphis robusta]MDY7055220.1 PIN domain-containing protein [Limnospira fusiformis LS22]QJB27950.1 PIN domain-containing protein [Limnospira fusiformis SAG 85.79]RAQ42858.1 PIN domain-containing protein [Arthrospira sp. O9.13F]
MRVLIDTNVVLDFLQEREPFVENAARIFQQIDAGEIEGVITATTITNIYYIIRKFAGDGVARDAIAQILIDLTIAPVNRDVLEGAIALQFADFEDAVQYVCGISHPVDVIVTRDVTGFSAATIPVVLPENFDDFKLRLRLDDPR